MEPFIFLSPEITRENAFTLIEWLQDDEVIKYLSDPHNISSSIEQVLNRVNLPVLTHLFNHNGRFFMACDRHNVPVGFVRLVKKGDETEIVIVIGDRKNWGKRLGASTIRESMKIAFFEFRSQKLIAKIHKDNKRSIKAFINAGFTMEQETSSTKRYSITMEEYMRLIREKARERDKIYITEIDRDRLLKIIRQEIHFGEDSGNTIEDLEREINRAIVVDPYQLPDNVITMNSRAVLNLDGDDMEVSLVYPEDADFARNKLSIFSPVGTAILGYSEGDIIKWEVPSGIMEIQIGKILYQPEAAGHYHL